MANPLTESERKRRKQVRQQPCEWCGTSGDIRVATHIFDRANGGPGVDWNLMSLCNKCHNLFDVRIKPRLHSALIKMGIEGLPTGWTKGCAYNELYCGNPEQK